MRKEIKFAGTTLLIAAGLFDHYTYHEDISKYLNTDKLLTLDTTNNTEVDFDKGDNLAALTVPYLYFPLNNEESAKDLEVLYRVRELTGEEVKSLLNRDIAQNETWWVMFFDMVYPKDGGPAKIGIQKGTHTLSLNSEGINLVKKITRGIDDVKDIVGHIDDGLLGTKDISKRFDDGHVGDVENQIIIGRQVGDKFYYELAYTNEHGEWHVHNITDLLFVDDQKGNPHIVFLVSINKNTEYPNLFDCNTAKYQGLYGWLRDKCTRSGILIEPRIIELHNVDRHKPFQESPALLEKYHGTEKALNENGSGSCFYGGASKKKGCRAKFNFDLPPVTKTN